MTYDIVMIMSLSENKKQSQREFDKGFKKVLELNSSVPRWSLKNYIPVSFSGGFLKSFRSCHGYLESASRIILSPSPPLPPSLNSLVSHPFSGPEEGISGGWEFFQLESSVQSGEGGVEEEEPFVAIRAELPSPP